MASTQITARGLTPCTAYRLRARARNTKGEGPWSPAFTCSTLEEVNEKLAPPALWSKTHERVHLVWMAVSPPSASSPAAASSPASSLASGAASAGYHPSAAASVAYELQMRVRVR